ncbi:MAG: RNA 2'-phosphotransferase [Anaerolineales bacterium]
MRKIKRTHYSKFLSHILRHQPGKIGLELDPGGWAEVDELITRANQHGVDLDRDALEEIVETSSKNRFEISPDGSRTRARYGHSLDVDLDYQPQDPPQILFHGTAIHAVEGIKQEGLKPQGRKFVHLSSTPEVARQVGKRHGEPVILRVDAAEMHQEGHIFYKATEEIWLVKAVPPESIYQIH